MGSQMLRSPRSPRSPGTSRPGWGHWPYRTGWSHGNILTAGVSTIVQSMTVAAGQPVNIAINCPTGSRLPEEADHPYPLLTRKSSFILLRRRRFLIQTARFILNNGWLCTGLNPSTTAVTREVFRYLLTLRGFSIPPGKWESGGYAKLGSQRPLDRPHRPVPLVRADTRFVSRIFV
jgi:hypothetical protein